MRVLSRLSYLFCPQRKDCSTKCWSPADEALLMPRLRCQGSFCGSTDGNLRPYENDFFTRKGPFVREYNGTTSCRVLMRDEASSSRRWEITPINLDSPLEVQTLARSRIRPIKAFPRSEATPRTDLIFTIREFWNCISATLHHADTCGGMLPRFKFAQETITTGNP